MSFRHSLLKYLSSLHNQFLTKTTHSRISSLQYHRPSFYSSAINHSAENTQLTSSNNQKDLSTESSEIQIPDPPTTCCMSGCANCVWIEYAQELAEIYKDGGEAAQMVMKAIDDPSIKIFISLELKEKFKSDPNENH